MFYENYIKLCASVGKSPSAVAVEIGIQKSNVTYWKTSGKTPSDVTLAKLAQYFNVSIADLLKPADEKKTKSPITSKIDEILSFNRISKADLLKACNISSDSYAKWDSGETMPTVNDLVRIAGYLHVTLGYLLEPEEEQKKEALSLDGKELTGVEGALVKLFRQIPAEKQSALLDSIEMTLRMQGLL